MINYYKEYHPLFFIIILLLISPFVQMDMGDSEQNFKLLLPSYISSFASIVRWGVFIVMTISPLFLRTKMNYNISRNFIILFYTVPLLYSLVSNTDTTRYISLFIFIFTIPFYIETKLNEVNIEKALGLISRCIILLFIISFIAGGINILNGYRFHGTMNNPNIYALMACFWIAVLLINNEYIPLKKINSIFAILIFITIFFSGSRNGIVSGILVFLFSMTKSLKTTIYFFVILTILFIVGSFIPQLDYFYDRIFHLSSAAEDSGRSLFWNKALEYIKLNPLGYGMNAPLELIGTGNIHNCYIRFLLTIGIFFTTLMVISLIFFILSLFTKRSKNVPKSLIGFAIAYGLANYGEDFFVGIGSSIFIALCFTLGLIFFFQNKNYNNSLK